jgi:glycosyltransferase involved in cell wall biosynthesis
VNILFVGTIPPHTGGSGVANGRYLVGCARLGHRIRALGPITEETEAAGRAGIGHPEIEVIRYPVTAFEVTPSLDPDDPFVRWQDDQVARRLPELIAAERPDVLLAGRESYLWSVSEIAAVYHLPCAVIVHGVRLVGALGGEWPEALARRLREQLRKVTRIVTSGRHLAESLRRVGLEDVRVVPNPVELERFSPGPRDPALLRELAVPEGAVIVLHPSNLKPTKRPLDVVRSAECALGMDPRLLYVVAGDGPLRDEMKELCEEVKVADRFRFPGWVETNDMPRWMNLADLVLMPSAWENQALVYLETMACGRVLVSSDIPAAREVVVDGETGLLFQPADVEDMTAKTLRAARDPALRAAIGSRAREAVRGHALEAVAARFAALLAEVVA